ncbi:hypothetical protein GALMADRAFT_233502 [Galerina marginata CBS 339.88]|uniref:Uncharacterized protein n=1 Tax=Galerina marginata (strain CBS 339.88) TaxID=685588 RepID=A0A067U0X4_GALM3|nr:hypothetical protein GALMADRAFT_233502 [Galerina marginata CBS 339.88]
MSEPQLSSPPPLSRSLSVDGYLQSQTNTISEGEYEDELTEQELRETYDNEEIDRFLHLFSAFVTEVQVPETPPVVNRDDSACPAKFLEHENVFERRSEDGEWTPIKTTSGEYFPAFMKPVSSAYGSLSEEIACNYLAPILPHARPAGPPFTIGRLRLATQRLYLAALPVYGPFFANLLRLATWEDYGTSLIYCCIFWTLWWYNFLAPALVSRILISLVKRRIFPYPTLDDLRRHREEISRADEFGQQVSARLSASSSGITEIWRLFKLLDQTRKAKLKARVKGKLNHAEEQEADNTSQGQDAATVLDDSDDSEEARDVKRLGLKILQDIADIHERIRNIFIWRRPVSSRKYGFILFAIFLTMLLPTRYIAKLVWFVVGFLFWHILPVLASLPPSEQKKLPPPFFDVPTDAEYAMDLISQRVAAGLEVEPSKPSKQSKRHKSSDSIETPDSNSKHMSNSSQSREGSIDWKKWGDRVAVGKSAINDIKRLRPGKAWPVHEVWPPQHPIIPGAIGIAQPQSNVEAHTYPCQHTSSPGLITLTHNTLLFTPLLSQDAKLVIQLAAVKGVKKAGVLKGLHIRWNDSSDGNNEQKEDKFLWVGGRDELFARLVGSDGRRWMKV